MNYKQQAEKDKPVVEVWNKAMQKEIAARLIKHFGYNMEVLCGRNVYSEQQLTTKSTDVSCNECLTILSWILIPECLEQPEGKTRMETKQTQPMKVTQQFETAETHPPPLSGFVPIP